MPLKFEYIEGFKRYKLWIPSKHKHTHSCNMAFKEEIPCEYHHEKFVPIEKE